MNKLDKAAEMKGAVIEKEFSSKAVTINEEKRTAVFVMSTASVDRHGDIVDQNSWNLEHFKENPAFFWGHRSDEFPLGKWVRVWMEADPLNEGQQILMGEAEFATEVDPEIERAWKHVVRGDINMVSVGFIPHDVDYDNERELFILKDCELMECSLVGIGSNRRATVKEASVKETLIETKEELEAEVEELPKESREAVRKAQAIHALNQAIRRVS